MDHVQVFMKTELFSLGEDDAIPPRALILDGRVREQPGGGLLLEVQVWRRATGAAIATGRPAVIYIPMAKIDHIRLMETTTGA